MCIFLLHIGDDYKPFFPSLSTMLILCWNESQNQWSNVILYTAQKKLWPVWISLTQYYPCFFLVPEIFARKLCSQYLVSGVDQAKWCILIGNAVWTTIDDNTLLMAYSSNSEMSSDFSHHLGLYFDIYFGQRWEEKFVCGGLISGKIHN